jgi:hypothetical protein
MELCTPGLLKVVEPVSDRVPPASSAPAALRRMARACVCRPVAASQLQDQGSVLSNAGELVSITPSQQPLIRAANKSCKLR